MNASLRAGTPADATGIAALDEREYGRSSDGRAIARLLERHPSAVAEYGGEVVGFAICGSFAPEVLEVRQLTVSPEHRGRGTGLGLLSRLEASVTAPFAWLVAVTSDLYRPGRAIQSSTAIYARAGFVPILDTGPTRVLAKRVR